MYQNCEKLTYKTFAKDYVFFACSKGQIIIHTTEVDGADIQNIEQNVEKQIYDHWLAWPYLLLLCGPTGHGKTTWIDELLRCRLQCFHKLVVRKMNSRQLP